jgi:hypothetical protein
MDGAPGSDRGARRGSWCRGRDPPCVRARAPGRAGGGGGRGQPARGCAATPAGRPPTPRGGQNASISVRNRRGNSRGLASIRQSSRRAAGPAARGDLVRVYIPTEQRGSTRRAHPPIRDSRRVESGITLEHQAAPPALARQWFSGAGRLLGVGLDQCALRAWQERNPRPPPTMTARQDLHGEFRPLRLDTHRRRQPAPAPAAEATQVSPQTCNLFLEWIL